MPESEKLPPDENSKSQRKRDVLALQDIGAKLMKLNESQLANLPLPEILLAAIKHGQTLKANEAKRRHLQYIGKLMREVEIEPLKLALKNLQIVKQKAANQFHEIEALRDKLIAGNDTDLQTFIEKYPSADRQHLRQLVRKAQQDRAKNKDTGGSTELFRYVKEIVK